MSDTRIGIYQGATVGALTPVALGDDTTPSDPRSVVTIDAVAGQTYHVQVGDAPGAGPAPLLLRWYAAVTPPQWSACDLPGDFITNASLEEDDTGWSPSAASSSDAAGRILSDAAHGSASYEVVIPTGAGRGFVYTDPNPHSFDGETTISVWLRVAGGTPRAFVILPTVDGTRLVPTDGGADKQATPSGSWQEFTFTYRPLPGVNGLLSVSVTTVGSTGALVLHADCLEAFTTIVAPVAPTNLACSPTTDALRLSWTAAPGAEGYRVRVNGVLEATILTPDTEATVDGLTPDTIYNADVRSFTTLGGESPAATITCATRPAPTSVRVDLACAALSFLELDGREVANAARDMTYLRLGLGGAWQVSGDPCAILLREIGYTPRAPALDPAPWHDSARPESNDFLGAHLAIDVVPSAARSVTLSATGRGAVLGPQRAAQTELQCTATLLAASSGGMAYGRRWLENRLRPDPADPCLTSVARIRVACPPDDGSNDTLGEYYLYDVGLTASPKPVAGTDGGNDCCAWQDYSFTLAAGQPDLYHRPRLCVAGTINNPPLVDCGGGVSALPFPEWFCGPGNPHDWLTSLSCSIDTPTLFGVNGAIVTVTADGGSDLIDIVIALYPPGTACPPPSGAVPTATMTIDHVPNGGVLVVDSARELVTFYPTTTDAANGTNAQTGVPFITIPDGQGVPWVTATPARPASCLLVGKRTGCGPSGSIRIETQLREA